MPPPDLSESKPLRPALLPIDHPLSYTHTRQSAQELKFYAPKSHEERIEYLYDRQELYDLLSEYSYRLDQCLVTHSAASWVDLFTADCEIVYPEAFGQHVGKQGLGAWILGVEGNFHRVVHTSGNHTIKFASSASSSLDEPVIAYGRSSMFFTGGTHLHDLGQVSMLGGYYYWTFRKENPAEGDSGWKIAKVEVDGNWTFSNADASA